MVTNKHPKQDSEEDDDDGDETQSDHQWCMHCERAYKRGEHRMISGIPMCPYPGCNGDTFSDGWDWDYFREPLPQYPAIPEYGVKYPMYPPKQPVLTDAGRNILQALVGEMGCGRFKPHDPESFCGYNELHTMLGLPQKGPHWGKSLENQGLADLAEWLQDMNLPAITGLIVGEQAPRLPGKGYYEINGQPNGSQDWWREQVQASIAYDWSPWVPDIEPVSLTEFSLESRTYVEGTTTQVTRETKARCDGLRKRAKELFRDADGFIRCRICRWHKPQNAMISGDIVELHHIDPIADAPAEGRTITVKDALELLVPVCPTCHRLIHSRTGGGHFEKEQLRKILGK